MVWYGWGLLFGDFSAEGLDAFPPGDDDGEAGVPQFFLEEGQVPLVPGGEGGDDHNTRTNRKGRRKTKR